MKITRTPEDYYFHSGYVTFSTSRKDGELSYKIVLWNEDRTRLSTFEEGKVKDKAHLDELQIMENEK